MLDEKDLRRVKDSRAWSRPVSRLTQWLVLNKRFIYGSIDICGVEYDLELR
jgi:hypothetical protein